MIDGCPLIGNNSYNSIKYQIHPPSRLPTRKRTNNPSVGSFINHSMNIALITSQIFSQIKDGTLVILVYDRETVLQVVHNRRHCFQKDLPCRGAQIATHTRSTSKKSTQNPTRHSRQSDHRIHKIFQGATPLSYPQRSWPAPERTQGFCGRL